MSKPDLDIQKILLSESIFIDIKMCLKVIGNYGKGFMAGLIPGRSLPNFLNLFKKQVRIHESTVACDWEGAVMPKNHEKS